MAGLSDALPNRAANLTVLIRLIRRIDSHGLIRTILASIISAIADVGALGLLIPFLTVVGKPTLIDTHWLIVSARKALEINSSVLAFMILSILTIFGLLILAALRIFARYMIVFFISRQRDLLCRELLAGHFYTSYWGHTERSTRDLLELVFGDADIFVDKAVRPMTDLLSNLLICGGFVIALLYADPFATMLMIPCGALYFLALFLITKSGIDAMGRLRATANKNRFRYALNILDGRRDIRIYGVDKPFFNAFKVASGEFARSVSANAILIQLSTYVTQAIALSAIVAGITLVILTRGDMSVAVPIFGTYVFAGARLVPALAAAYSAWSELRFAGPAVRSLDTTLAQASETLADPAHESRTDRIALLDHIVLSNVSFGYPRGRTVHCSSDLRIRAGDIIGVTGESGAGKSALLLSLMGLLPLKSGSVLIDGVAISLENRRAWLNNISYIGQSPFFLDDSVAANIAFGVAPENQDRAKIINASKAAGADEFILHDIPGGYDGMIGEGGLRLSGGQLQRLAIARGLYAGRQVLLLDEMTSALDEVSERKVVDTLKQLGRTHTILIVTHRRAPLEICELSFHYSGRRTEADFSEGLSASRWGCQMRIGVVYELVDGGGAPLVVRNQVKHLNDCGHQVTFITAPRTLHQARSIFPFARVAPLLTGRRSMALHVIFALISLRVQLIILHSTRTASYFGFFATLCGCRVIVVEHANPQVTLRGLTRRQRCFLAFVLKRCTVVCVSFGAARAFEETFGVRAQVVYNFVDFGDDLKTTTGVAPREDSIVFMGRLVYEKDVGAVIDCFDKIAPLCNWRLEIIGDGEELEILQKKVIKSKYKDRIRFGGWVERPRSVLACAGIFVLTSRYEGFGIALAEAMSLGTPCVSFDCPFGPGEIIENGRSGILVPNGDVDKFAEALLRLVRDLKLRAELGAAAISRSAKFSMRAHNSAWDRIISEARLQKVRKRRFQATSISGSTFT